ncbi:MAG: hypothetical protein SOW68_11990 [Eubacteriales bacterium]|nr:hypothetical protein [Eubacteriales bacterium]
MMTSSTAARSRSYPGKFHEKNRSGKKVPPGAAVRVFIKTLKPPYGPDCIIPQRPRVKQALFRGFAENAAIFSEFLVALRGAVC